MRTIRFRAKPCYMGGNQPAWVYGTFQYIAQRRVRPGATDNGTLEPRNDKGRIVDLYGTETEVLCDTVGQFTGLRDINGKDIYEGDIIRQDVCGDGSNGVVVYDEKHAMFALRYYDPHNPIIYGLYDCQEKELEILGNIYDNPELLED